jgi:tetratricopeptide (TPR) repeat protein
LTASITEQEKGGPSPGLAAAYAQRGELRAGWGQWAEAVADYTTALQFAPQAAWPYRLRAAAYREMGETEKAQADEAQARAVLNENLARWAREQMAWEERPPSLQEQER